MLLFTSISNFSKQDQSENQSIKPLDEWIWHFSTGVTPSKSVPNLPLTCPRVALGCTKHGSFPYSPVRPSVHIGTTNNGCPGNWTWTNRGSGVTVGCPDSSIPSRKPFSLGRKLQLPWRSCAVLDLLCWRRSRAPKQPLQA